MAYSVPLTAVANATLTAAQWNASMRDNMLLTPAALATATGRMYISNGVNSIAERVPTLVKTLGGAQGTTSTSFVNLTTTGPIVGPLSTGTSAIFAVSTYALSTVAQAGAYMGVAVSGATTIAADVLSSLRVISEVASTNHKHSYVSMFSGTLTAGSNTFTAKYASTSGASTATFEERELMVIPL